MRRGRMLGSPRAFPSSALLSISASSKRPLASNDQGFTVAILTGVELLAMRAVPGAAAACARLLDRRAAPRARLAGPAIDLELVLHGATTPFGIAVVPQRRPLPGDPHLES